MRFFGSSQAQLREGLKAGWWFLPFRCWLCTGLLVCKGDLSKAECRKCRTPPIYPDPPRVERLMAVSEDDYVAELRRRAEPPRKRPCRRSISEDSLLELLQREIEP